MVPQLCIHIRVSFNYAARCIGHQGSQNTNCTFLESVTHMQAYQKKEGKKHKISPRSTRTRSQREDGTISVPDDHSNQLNKAEINGKIPSIQVDLTEIKEK